MHFKVIICYILEETIHHSDVCDGSGDQPGKYQTSIKHFTEITKHYINSLIIIEGFYVDIWLKKEIDSS